ncbi:MAG: alpha/beta hydrolase [Saprospiraceae bacterium]|nr:alpha/beta hydrolase [Saprospiraceae bacterium]
MTKYTLLMLMLTVTACQVEKEPSTEAFSFSHQGYQYHGFVDLPAGLPKAIILLIPGSGVTDFMGSSGFSTFFQKKRDFFLSLGYGVVAWDKKGCGKNEGTFTEDLTIDQSAEVAQAALEELDRRETPGSDKIGLWGISRGGWVCPKIIEEVPDIAFWISISGTDQFENSRYLLEANLRLEGKSQERINILLAEWDYRTKALRNGAIPFETFLEQTEELYQEPFFQQAFEPVPTQEDYDYVLDYYQNSDDVFDDSLGLRVMVPNFEKVLRAVTCPVLAILGQKDSQVNWRSTASLYQSTLPGDLQVVEIPNCNHLMMKCKTGGMFENLESFGYELCEEYYSSMSQWLASWENQN